MKVKCKMIDYDYEQTQMRIERKEGRMTKAEKRAEILRKWIIVPMYMNI